MISLLSQELENQNPFFRASAPSAGINNFLISTFRLLSGCIKELESICTDFLLSGPALNTRKAKVAWSDICKPKQEGGLEIRHLKEANKVSCLNLIWRIVSSQPSLAG